MKLANLFLLAFVWLVSLKTHAQILSNDDPTQSSLKQSFKESYLKDLEELGYCIIPGVLSADETDLLYQRIWHEYIEKAWPSCKMDDRSNWKETFPIQNHLAIFAGPAGQTQVMWDIRQDPRIIHPFAQIWNTNDLIVSMDGLSIMCPQEIREGYVEPWPHVDQSILIRLDNVAHDNNPTADFISESALATKPFTIQGQFLFEDSDEYDGGFYCIPKSHLRFEEFAPIWETLNTSQSIEIKQSRRDYLLDFFDCNLDESGNPYCKKQIAAPKGSLILWDSRTVHWNQHASTDRPPSDFPKVRMVGYLCYVPKARLTDKNRTLRIEIFEEGVSTGHNPASPEPKRTLDHIWPEFKQYVEDPSYVHPKIHLTELGKSLLGL